MNKRMMFLSRSRFRCIEQTPTQELARSYFITINSSPIQRFRITVYSSLCSNSNYSPLESRLLQNGGHLFRDVGALQEEIEHSLLTQNLLRLNTPPNSHMDVRKEHVDHLSSLDSSRIRRFDRAARYHFFLSLRSKQLVRVRWHVGWVEQKNIHLVLRITR